MICTECDKQASYSIEIEYHGYTGKTIAWKYLCKDCYEKHKDMN